MLIALGAAGSAVVGAAGFSAVLAGAGSFVLFVVFLDGQILQIDFAVRAENQPRIKIGESNLADAQLKRLEIELHGIERQGFPFQKILLPVFFHGAKFIDLHTALVVHFRRAASAGIVSQFAFRADASAGQEKVDLVSEKRLERKKF